MYQSPRDILNPPTVQANTIRFKTPLQKFYATGAEFQHPLSASMGPQSSVRVAKMPTRTKLQSRFRHGSNTKQDRQLNAHMQNSYTPDPFQGNGPDMSEVSAYLAKQQLNHQQPISRTKVTSVNNRTDAYISPAPSIQAASKQMSAATPSAGEQSNKMANFFSGTSSFPM